MISYITIDSVDYKIQYGASIVLDGTEEFDSGEVIIKHIPFSTPFPEGEDAVLTIGANTYYFIIQADRVDKINSSTYNHTLTLVEETAKLSKYYSVDRYFTLDSTGNLLTHKEILDVIWNTVRFGRGMPYTIATATNTALDVESPSKKYEGMNTYEITRDLFRGIKSVPRLENGTLSHTPYNELNNPITIDNVNAEQRTSDYNNYATTVVSKAKNIVNETNFQSAGTYFPSDSEGIRPRTDRGQYTDESAQWQLDKPIRGHLSFKLLDVNIIDSTGTLPAETVDLDITNYVVSKEKWDGLPLGSNVLTTLVDEIAQRNTIYYTIGDNVIENLANEFPQGGGVAFDCTVIEALIRSVLDNDGTHSGFVWNGGPQYGSGATEQEIVDLKLQTYFYPQYEADISSEKWDTDVNKRSEILNNQGDRIVDIERYGSILNDLAQRMANGTYIVGQRHADETELWELNDYTSDGYKIIRANHTVYFNHIDSVYQFAKNWVTIDGYQTVYRSTDPYIIGRDNVHSNFRYEEYIEFSTTQRTDTGNLTTQGFKTLLNMFDFATLDNLPIYHAQFKNEDGTNNQSTNAITMSCIAEGSNVIRLHTGFIGPKLAGNQLFEETSYLSANKFYNKPIYYTDENGYLDEASVYFINDVTTDPDDHPLTSYSSTVLWQLTNENYYLNPNDIWGLSVELKPSTDEPDAIVVGEAFAKYNNLVYAYATSTPVKLYICGATTKYNTFDRYVKESVSSTTSYFVSFASNYIDVSGVSGIDGKTWALGWEDGSVAHLILAVNYDGTDRQRIYLNNLKERSTTETL